ncbi:MAG TPA: hypothetical protein VHX44_07190, partial [Planctomycetota bacterium]|nr:hypothetical protein [Planctomycetota bacterium]
RMFLTPRAKIAAAPGAWFDLQRSWWKGTTPVTRGFPAPSVKYRRALDDGWAWTPASGEEQSKAWADPGFDASSWKPTDLGVLSFPGQPPTKQLALRKVITVPKEWSDGRITLSLRSSGYPDFAGVGRLWIDGTLVQNWGGEAVDQIGDTILTPGSTHTLLIETKTDGTITGVPGSCWLSFQPKPQQTIDLAGTWETTPDLQHLSAFTGTVTLPGPYNAKVMRRTVKVLSPQRGKTAAVSIIATRAFGLFVNSTYLPFSGGPTKNGCVVNVTPFLHYDADNVIELVSPYDRCEVKHVSLDFYDPGLAYP